MPTVTLAVVHGPMRGKEFIFTDRTTAVIGRAPDCVPRLPDDKEHRTVSRHHCLLDINPPAIRIRDFGSRNGTYVNGAQIGRRPGNPAADRAAPAERDLADGDQIRIGSTVFKVRTGRNLPPTKVLPHTDLDAAAERLLERAGAGDPDAAPLAGYALAGELGRGGMGRVHLARHSATGACIALKVMLPAAAASPFATGRFLREIAITKALRHPHIVAQHATGQSAGVFYFTTEYCPGGTLDQLIRRRGGRLEIGEAVPLAVQALEALEYAHGRRVVHRDITPQNILLTGRPRRVKLADFGLAKAFDLAGLSGLTRTGTAAGKPFFIPYQQVVNFRAAGPPVDVWSLAACLYFAITGFCPRDFPAGKDPWQVVLQTRPVPIRQRRPAVPAGLARVIDRALHDRPEFGITTAADLAKALARL